MAANVRPPKQVDGNLTMNIKRYVGISYLEGDEWEGSKGRGKGKDGPQIPYWFAQPNISRRSAADGNNPFGEQMCFPRHHPDGDQCTRKDACWMCHTCPVKHEDGSICGADHAASAHTPYPF